MLCSSKGVGGDSVQGQIMMNVVVAQLTNQCTDALNCHEYQPTACLHILWCKHAVFHALLHDFTKEWRGKVRGEVPLALT